MSQFPPLAPWPPKIQDWLWVSEKGREVLIHPPTKETVCKRAKIEETKIEAKPKTKTEAKIEDKPKPKTTMETKMDADSEEE